MKQLDEFRDGDGAHCGLSDWYPEQEAALKAAIESGEDFTTGWYGSKKELASARITKSGGELIVSVSVCNDFDIEGLGRVEYDFYPDIEVVRRAIDEAWEEADKDQENNNWVAMYAILHKGKCVDIFLADMSVDGLQSEPPGDCYQEWGWQEEAEIPDDIKRELERLIWGIHHGEIESDEVTYCGYTVKYIKD